MPQVSFPALVNDKAYVPGLSREYVAREYGIAVENVVKLGSAENPFGASPKAKQAVEEARQRLDIYPDWTAAGLREAVARKYKLDPNCIVCGSGETEIISTIIRAFAAPGQPILMFEPCFPIYHIYANCEGRQPVYVPMGKDFIPDITSYVTALRKQPSIAFITNPNNPTGSFFEESAIRRICEAASDRTLVVLDEAYIHYTETNGGLHLLSDYSNLIVLRTFSKAFGLAGLRIGFGASAKPELIRPLWNIKPTWNMGQAQIAGGIAALDDDEHVNMTVKAIVEMRAYVGDLLRGFNRFRMVSGSRSNFFLLEVIDTTLSSTVVFNQLLKRGVIVKDGKDIRGLGERYMRVDVSLKKNMDTFVSALREIEISGAAD